MKKLLNNDYFFNLFAKIYSTFTGLVTSILLARYLGVLLRGEYTFINQVVSVSSLIINLGIHQSYSYFCKSHRKSLLDRYLVIYLFQFILLSVVSLFLIAIQNVKSLDLILILIPSSIFVINLEATWAVENIKLKIKLHIVTNTLRMISFIVMYFFIPTSIFVPIVISLVINIIIITVYLTSIPHKPNLKNLDTKLLIKIIAYSWVPMLTSLLGTLNYSADIFFLKGGAPAYELGIYSLSLSIINYIWIIPDAFKEVLISRVTRSSSNDATIFTTKVSLYLVIFVIIVFLLLGSPFITFFYGAEFSESYYVAAILSIGAISMVFYKIIGIQLLSEGRRWFYFFSLLISVIINVILNIILIPKFGMYGAAIASIFSYTFCGIIFLIYYTHIKEIKFRRLVFFNKTEIESIKSLFMKEEG